MRPVLPVVDRELLKSRESGLCNYNNDKAGYLPVRLHILSLGSSPPCYQFGLNIAAD